MGCVLSPQSGPHRLGQERHGHASGTVGAPARPPLDGLWALRYRLPLRATVPRIPIASVLGSVQSRFAEVLARQRAGPPARSTLARPRQTSTDYVELHISRRAWLPQLRRARCRLALPSFQSPLPTRLHDRHDQSALQGLGQAFPQHRRGLGHRRPARPQGPAREHRRQVPPLRPRGRLVDPDLPQIG